MYVCVCMYACNVCMSVSLCVYIYVCMYVALHFPFAPQYFSQKNRFSSVFAKRMSKNTEFYQIFGKRMQEAQASKKAGRGNRAWETCFATFSGTSSNCRAVRGGPPPPQNPTYLTSGGGGGGGKGGGVILYPLVSIRHAEQCQRILDMWNMLSLNIAERPCSKSKRGSVFLPGHIKGPLNWFSFRFPLKPPFHFLCEPLPDERVRKRGEKRLGMTITYLSVQDTPFLFLLKSGQASSHLILAKGYPSKVGLQLGFA